MIRRSILLALCGATLVATPGFAVIVTQNRPPTELPPDISNRVQTVPQGADPKAIFVRPPPDNAATPGQVAAPQPNPDNPVIGEPGPSAGGLTTNADQTISNGSDSNQSDSGAQASENEITANNVEDQASQNNSGAVPQNATADETNESSANATVNAANEWLANNSTDDGNNTLDPTTIALVVIVIVGIGIGIGIGVRHFRKPPAADPFVPVTITPKLGRAFDGSNAPDWKYTGPITRIRCRLELGEVAWTD